MAQAKIDIDVGYRLDKDSYDKIMTSLIKIEGVVQQQSSNKNGLSKELKEAGKAAAELQTIMKSSWDEKLNQINLTKLNTELKKAGTSATEFYNKLAQGGKEGVEGANAFARSIVNANVQLKQSNQLLDKMAVTFKNTVRYGISSSIFNKMANSIQQAYNYTKQLDTSLNDIRIVSNQTAEQMEEFAVSANKAAQSLGKTTLDYTKAATIYFQQGLSTSEVEARTEATLKAANVTGQSAQEVSEQLTAVWNGYRVANDELELYVDKLAAVAANSASNLEELSTGMSKVASAANLMGVDIDQLTAQMSTIISVTRQAPESVGTALRTIYARMADIKAGLDSETSLGNYSGKMKKLGINVLDANGNLREMGDVIEDVGEKWSSMTKEQQVSLAQVMAGTRQYNNLLTLFENWDKYESAMETSANAAGTLQKQQNIYMESTEAHLKQLQAEAEELYSALFDQEAVRSFIDIAKNGLDILGNYIKGLGGGLNTLIGLGSQLANIFSGQIASSIGNALQNFEVSKQNKSDDALKGDLLNLHLAKGDSVEDAALEKELAYAKQIREVRKSLTNEQAQELTAHQQQIGLLEEEILKNQKLIELKKKKATKSISASLSGSELEDLKEFSKNGFSITEEDWNNLDTLSDKLNNLYENTDNLSKQQRDTQQSIEEILEKRITQLQEIKNLETDNSDLQKQQTAHEQIIAAQIQQAEKQQLIQDIIKSTSAILMTISSIQSIWNIFTDEDLSTWDKFKSIVGILAMQLPMLVSSYTVFVPLVKKAATAIMAKSAAITADTALTAANTKSAVKNTAGQTANAAARGGVTVATGAQSVAGVINTAILEAETVATNSASVAMAIFKAICGDTTGLMILGVAGIAALGIGLVGLVGSLVNTKSKEEELNEELERNQTKLQETTDAYEELKNTISNYQDAKNGLDELTEGTLEFYDAILKANKEAQELIEKFNLLEGSDYTFNEDGLIELKDEALERVRFTEQQKVYRDSADVTSTNIKKTKYDLDKFYSNFNDTFNAKTGIPVHFNEEQINKILLGSNGDLGKLDTWWTYDLFKGWVTKGDNSWDSFSEEEQQRLAQQFAPELKALNAKLDNYQNQLASQIIRGYASQDTVKTYNAMSEQNKAYVNAAANNVPKKSMTVRDSWWTEDIPLLGELFFTPIANHFADTETVYYEDEKGMANAAENMVNLYKNSKSDANKWKLDKSAAEYYANMRLAMASSEPGSWDVAKENWGKLTEQERKTIYDNDELIQDKVYYGSLGLKPTDVEVATRASEETKAYNEQLKISAEELGTSENALKMYAAAMKNAGDLTGQETAAMADQVAESYKFNKAYNDSVKIYQSNEDAIDDWTEAWKNHEKVSYEVADAMGELTTSLKGIFGHDVSAEFVTENIDTIKTMLTGTEEEAEKAYLSLQTLATVELFKDTFGDSVIDAIIKTEDELKNFASYFSTLEAGPVEQKYANQLIDMINSTQMTKEQIETLFASMHLKVPDLDAPEVAVKKNKVPSETQVTTTEHSFSGTIPVSDGNGGVIVKEVPDAWGWTETITTNPQEIYTLQKDLKIESTGGSATGGNFKKAPSNTKKNKSSGKASKKDLNKEQLDRYQLVNVQLKEISKQLSKLDKQKNKLLGGQLVNNLNQQIKLLNDQISVTEAKLKIAQGEQDEVAKKLSGYGITFDKDGNIANYAQIFNQEQVKLNAIYTNYNNMSKEAQDNYADTVKAAEESWKTFKESITKYDSLIGDTIPTLEQDIATAFDKQTEMFIEEFNAEIKVRLDMASAEREWNEFKTKVIDGIKDDDVLGLAASKLKDFNTYYNEQQTGEVQALTKQIQNQLDELRKQDEEGGQGDWYRDNRVKAMEDLKERYDQIRDSLTALVELEEEMKQKILDSMDQAQDKFDAQIDTFENINKQLEHNVELINLLTDQDNYEQLADQYAAQTQNRKEELDFYTQQKDFWENYLNTLEEGSEEWETAKEKYNAAAEAWSSALATTIQAARTEFENNIKIIFKTINNQLTNQKGLDYINEEWELISTNSELALDNINKMQGLQDLNKKYNDAINGTSSIKAQQKLAQLRDSELEALKSMDKLSQQDLERAEKKLDIIKAQIALEDAQANKSKMRMRRDSQGNYRYQFVADEDQVNEAQANLYSAYNELYNFDKARYTNTLSEAAKAWEEYQQKMAEVALINDPEVRAQKEELIKSQYNEKIGILHEQLQRTMQELNQSTFAELNALYGENEQNYELMTEDQRLALNQFENANQTAFDLVFDLYTENTEAFHNMAQDQIDVIQNQMVPQWVSGYQTLVDAITGEGGIEEVSNRMMTDIQHAIETYDVSLANTEDIAKNTFDRITSGQNDVIKNNEQLLKDNADLINQYGTMINNVKALYYGDEENGITGLVQMMNAYKTAADNAKDAAKEAYDYWTKAKEKEAEEYKKNTDAGPTQGGTGQYEHNNQENLVQKETKQYPDIGSWVQLPTGTYFYDAWGNAYKYPSLPGRTVQIKSTSGDLWKVYNSQLDPSTVYIRKSSIGYDTGGYTGEWGNEGRLAMLHQKELVLNKKDTANMLDAVEIMRGITDNIGSDVLSRMASVSAGSLGSAFGGNVLDQNVHIEATFPGVKSSIEIQDALNNLVNMAAQRAQVK